MSAFLGAPFIPYITDLLAKARAPLRRPVRRFGTDDRAVSEIVGALMLILIVFAAASSLALFVQAQQKEYEEQQRFEQDRLLERIEVQKVEPVLNTTTGDTWKELNFTVTSLHVNPSYLAGLYLNGEPLETWTLWRFNATSGQTERVVHVQPQELKVGVRERFVVHVNLTTDGYLPIDITTSDKLELEVSTWLGNRFGRAFLPPSAIAFVETESVWNGTAYETVLVLDGSGSEALGGASLVSWEWSVEPDGLSLHGRKARADLTELAGNHTITLKVTDNFGMVDELQIKYYY